MPRQVNRPYAPDRGLPRAHERALAASPASPPKAENSTPESDVTTAYKIGELGQKTRFFSITTEYAKPSAGKSALVQKLLFLGGSGAAQDSISMRETPKASNNIAVDFRPTQRFRRAAAPSGLHTVPGPPNLRHVRAACNRTAANLPAPAGPARPRSPARRSAAPARRWQTYGRYRDRRYAGIDPAESAMPAPLGAGGPGHQFPRAAAMCAASKRMVNVRSNCSSWHTSGRVPPRARTRERSPHRASRAGHRIGHVVLLRDWPLEASNEKAWRGFMDALRFLQNLDLRRLRTLRAHRRHEADADSSSNDFSHWPGFPRSARTNPCRPLPGDEAITFFRVEPLNDAGFHTVFPRN